MIVNRNPRSYEVSIWTLQDSFITVLKSPYLEHKGQIENPELSLKDDSEDTFSFRIPMYIRQNGIKIENPNWFNVKNGNLIADMRKLKVIFNKGELEEEVFEFLITKVTEKHEGFETWCEVESEGLAFHELGKTGYKIELSSEIFNIEYNDWADNNGDISAEPINNIDYWIKKVLDNTLWKYEICMDWRGYSNRDNSKVYEDAYIADWNINNGELVPEETVFETEKLRLVDGKEDNRFNLLQTIAETFGVYCTFKYEYDDNYHIINRKVIYYNNFFKENEEIFDLTYHYDTEDISREMDSTELITKMIVLNQSNENTENSITEVDANPLLEDYLLNFDYLYSIGAISQEQYDEIKVYNTDIHDLNVKIKRISERISSYENILIQAQATYETAKQAITLDQERMQEEGAYINYLLEKSNGNVEARVLTVTKETARPYYPMGDERYVIPYNKYAKDVRVFRDKECTDEIKKINRVMDDDNIFCERITGIDANVVYLTYDYSPDLYHKLVYEQWQRKFNDDSRILDTYEPIIKKLNGARDASNELIDKSQPGLIQECQNKLKQLLQDKNLVIIKFENMMGPALREGTWQPEDSYGKYGSHKNIELNFASTQQNDVSLLWDNELFEEEETNYYEEGVGKTKIYYPCIDISNYLTKIKDYIGNEVVVENDSTTKQFGLIINDKYINYIINYGDNGEIIRTEETADKYKVFPVKYSFIRKNGLTVPIFILTGIQDYYDSMCVNKDTINLNTYINNLEGKIGYLITTVSIDENQHLKTSYSVETNPLISNINLVANIDTYVSVYPRIKFNSYNLKTSEDELRIRYGNDDILQVNNDYYILSKYNNSDGTDIDWDLIDADIDNENYIYGYYITIRPEVLFRAGTLKDNFYINYTLNNAGLMIYLDAIKILKENSMPKVSYNITPKLVKKNFIKNMYAYMHYLVHINDYELKFNNVMGYISGIELKLDTPWEDSIEIKNYKTKFEDLFTSIVASTEAMKKNSAAITYAASAFTATGNLASKVLQNSISLADLNYAFNNGKLTINEKDGIWATSENGVVAFNGGGIFTATEKDSDGNWIWNTGLLPRGISANAITAGQLNTNLIRIYAGDDLRFQMNGEGLFAYKSWIDDYVKVNDESLLENAETYNDRNPGQYVVHNSDGLFLIAEAGSKPIYEKIQKQSRQIKDSDKLVNWPVLKNNQDITEGFAIDSFIATKPLEKQVRRVEISWDGLKLSNWQGEPTFYADPDTGDLIIGGTLLQNASFITVPTSIIEDINEQLSPAVSTLRSFKKGALKGATKAISELSNNEFHEFSEYVLNELENDYLRSEEEEKHVRFLTPNVAAVKVTDYVNWSAASISNEILEEAFNTTGRIENRLNTVAMALTEYGLEYKTILNNITEIQLVDTIPTDNVKEFTTIRLNKDVGTYKAGESYYYDGEKWNKLESRNINLYTGGNLNLLGANATFAAGSELKMFAGGKLHLFGGEVYISSTDIANNQTEQDKLAETPLNGIVMDNNGLAIYSRKNITIGVQTQAVFPEEEQERDCTIGLELNGNNGSFTVITDTANDSNYKNSGIKFYTLTTNNNNKILNNAMILDGTGITINTNAKININSTNFQVNSNASNNEDIFYVGNNDKYIKYTKTTNGLLEIKGDIRASNIYASNIYADGSYVYTGTSPSVRASFSAYVQSQATTVLRQALDSFLGDGSIQGAITKRLDDITAGYTEKIKEVNGLLKVSTTSGPTLPNSPNNFDTFTPTIDITAGNNTYKKGYKYVYIVNNNNGEWQEVPSLDLFIGTSGKINMYSGSTFNLYSGANMTIASDGNMTIAAGGNMTIGTSSSGDAPSTLSLLSTGKLIAYGAEIRLATVNNETGFNNLVQGTDITGSYLWMHKVNEGTTANPIWKNKLDIGTTGDFHILSGGNFSAIATNEVLIASAEHQNNGTGDGTPDPEGSYIWMHQVNIGTELNPKYQQQLDIGTTGTLHIDSSNLIFTNSNSTLNAIQTYFSFNNGEFTISNSVDGGWSTKTTATGYSINYEQQAIEDTEESNAQQKTVFSADINGATTIGLKIGNITIKESPRGGQVWIKE